jgi:hypothetical protein
MFCELGVADGTSVGDSVGTYVDLDTTSSGAVVMSGARIAIIRCGIHTGSDVLLKVEIELATDDCGAITRDGFTAATTSVEPDRGPAFWQSVFRQLDRDNDGLITVSDLESTGMQVSYLLSPLSSVFVAISSPPRTS